MLIPACSPYDDRFPVASACLYVFEHSVRIGEVNDNIHISQALRCKRKRIFVVARREHVQLVTMLSRYLSNKRSSFAVAKQEKIRCESISPRSHGVHGENLKS